MLAFIDEAAALSNFAAVVADAVAGKAAGGAGGGHLVGQCGVRVHTRRLLTRLHSFTAVGADQIAGVAVVPAVAGFHRARVDHPVGFRRVAVGLCFAALGEHLAAHHAEGIARFAVGSAAGGNDFAGHRAAAMRAGVVHGLQMDNVVGIGRIGRGRGDLFDRKGGFFLIRVGEGDAVDGIPAGEGLSAELAGPDGDHIARPAAGHVISLCVEADSVFHNDGIAARRHGLADFKLADLTRGHTGAACLPVGREVDVQARYHVDHGGALDIAAGLFAVEPVVGFVGAEDRERHAVDFGRHGSVDEAAQFILMDIPCSETLGGIVKMLGQGKELVLVGQLFDLAGEGGVTAGLFALRGLLTEGVLGGLNGALEVDEAVGFLVGGGAPFKPGIAKRLFRAAGLALFPVARIVILDGVHTLVGGEGAVIGMPADLAGAGLDARILVGRLLLYHPAAVNVILGLGAWLFGGAADAAGDVDVGNGDAVTNGTVGVVEHPAC